MVDALIDIIGREAALFEQFLQLLERQQQALVTNDLVELNLVTEQQQKKLAESQLLGCEQEEVLRRIRVANAIDGDLTVSRLVKMVDRNRADQLLSLRDAILALNEKILTVRNQNALLINKSREYIKKTMELLSRVGSPGGSTAAEGAPAAHGSVGLDRRV